MYDRFRLRMESAGAEELLAVLQRYNKEIGRLSDSFAVDEINDAHKCCVEQLDNVDLKLAWYDSEFREAMKDYCRAHPVQLDEFLLKANQTLSYSIWGGGGLLTMLILLTDYKWWALGMLCISAVGGGIAHSHSKGEVKALFIKKFDEYAQFMEARIVDWIKTVKNECLNKFNEFNAKNHV